MADSNAHSTNYMDMKTSVSPSGFEPTSPKPTGVFFKAQVSLRIIATILSLAAVCLMVTSEQSTYLFTIQYKASYTYSTAFRFLAATSIIVCVCSLLSMIAICCFTRVKPPSFANTNTFFFSMFLHDLMMTALAIAGCAAATAIGYVALRGQEQTGWGEICSRVNVFCDKVIASIALSYLAFLCLFALTILSSIQGTSRSSTC